MLDNFEKIITYRALSVARHHNVDDLSSTSMTSSSTDKIQPVHVNQYGIIYMFINYIGV